MSIVCGSDFSESSLQAANVAAELAARMRAPLHLVHALDLVTEQPGDAPAARAAGDRLRADAASIADIGAAVQIHAEPGAPDEVLLEVAKRHQALLIVVAALGRRAAGPWQLGSHADRIAQGSHVPVLVVRDAAPFHDWLAGKRPLRIVLGADLSLSSETAMAWIGSLLALGPCEVTALHLYWPPEQFQRLGLHGVRDFMGPHSEVKDTLGAKLRERLEPLLGSTPLQVRVEPHMGRIGDRIAALAEQAQADLVVVGSHERSAVDRIMAGSVSRGLLHRASSSVACVPAPARPKAQRAPELARVLVASDFSPTGDAAIPLAFSIVPASGAVHLVHVVPESPHPSTEPHDIFSANDTHAELREGAHKRVSELLPDSRARGAVHVHVLESNEVAEAICQAAERLDASVICLGTHGRSGLSQKLLGSVAQGVLQRTRRPVLLAHPPVA
jgi:nucleotide-binding universal stress UspA family protein